MGITARLSIIVSAMIVVAAVIVGVAVYQSRPKPVTYNADTVAVVGNHQISNDELGDYTVTGVDSKAALTCIMNKYLYQDMASKYGATVSDAQIDAEFSNRFNGETTTQTKYYRTCLTGEMLQHAVEVKMAGSSIGKLYLITFDGAVPSTNIGEKVVMTAAEQRQFNSDSALAKTKAQTTYNALKAGSITMDQAIAQELADPKFGETAAPNALQSGAFSTADSLSQLGIYVKKNETLSVALANLSPGQTSSLITVGRAFDPSNNTNLTPTHYAILQLTSSDKASKQSFDQAVAAQKTLGYKVVKS